MLTVSNLDGFFENPLAYPDHPTPIVSITVVEFANPLLLAKLTDFIRDEDELQRNNFLIKPLFSSFLSQPPKKYLIESFFSNNWQLQSPASLYLQYIKNKLKKNFGNIILRVLNIISIHCVSSKFHVFSLRFWK